MLLVLSSDEPFFFLVRDLFWKTSPHSVFFFRTSSSGSVLLFVPKPAFVTKHLRAGCGFAWSCLSSPVLVSAMRVDAFAAVQQGWEGPSVSPYLVGFGFFSLNYYKSNQSSWFSVCLCFWPLGGRYFLPFEVRGAGKILLPLCVVYLVASPRNPFSVAERSF